MRSNRPLFLARKRDEDTMHSIGVAPGNGTDDYIAELHIDVSLNVHDEYIVESSTMADVASLKTYEFISARTLKEVDTDLVIDKLRHA